ncbi:MAG: hypothetical protein Q7W54_05175 [Bacteroidota bacterium]|nr:hypothetical protein [Bacteroidota bacterium]
MKAQIFLTGLAIMVLTTFTSAQNPCGGRGNGNGMCNGTGKGVAFVDSNKDGICDNFGTGKSVAQKGKRDGTGNGLGQGKGKGRNFVDADKNGVCDTYEARTKK